jgi:hypothetical protein
MEIELEVGHEWKTVAVPLVIVLLAGLVLIGRAVTPPGGGILTPSAWKLRQAERDYLAEMDELRQEAQELADILNRAPDAVRAGLAADRIAQLTASGHAALSLQRQALSDAAEAVRLWAMGGSERLEAEEALSTAIALLSGTGEP